MIEAVPARMPVRAGSFFIAARKANRTRGKARRIGVSIWANMESMDPACTVANDITVMIARMPADFEPLKSVRPT